MLQLCHSLIFIHVAQDPYRSSLVHFAGVLGIDRDQRRFRSASDYSYILAGLVYGVRILAVEKLIPREAREDEEHQMEVRERFREQRAQYLVVGSYSPMSYLLSLLGYSKKIALKTGNPSSVS